MQIKLKTDHAGSSYGLPVAIIDGQACGPADGMYGRSAADHVHDWASRAERTAEEIDMARKFLAQWPDGPQLPERVGKEKRAPSSLVSDALANTPLGRRMGKR